MAFDRHMNMVLGDAEEYRKIKNKKGSGLTEEKLEKRTLGLIVLRGDSVVSLTIEGPPPPELDEKGNNASYLIKLTSILYKKLWMFYSMCYIYVVLYLIF